MKGENAGDQYFLLYSAMISVLSKERERERERERKKHHRATLKLSFANAFNLDKAYILSSGKGISQTHTFKDITLLYSTRCSVHCHKCFVFCPGFVNLKVTHLLIG